MEERLDDSTLLVRVPNTSLPLTAAANASSDGSPIPLPDGCTGVPDIQQDVFYAEHFMRLDASLEVTGDEMFTGGAPTTYDVALAADQSQCIGAAGDPTCAMVTVRFFAANAWDTSYACRTPSSFATAVYATGFEPATLSRARSRRYRVFIASA